MKRSRINTVNKDMRKGLRNTDSSFPPFADFSAREWQSLGHDYDEIRDNKLGWDITDHGLEKV